MWVSWGSTTRQQRHKQNLLQSFVSVNEFGINLTGGFLEVFAERSLIVFPWLIYCLVFLLHYYLKVQTFDQNQRPERNSCVRCHGPIIMEESHLLLYATTTWFKQYDVPFSHYGWWGSLGVWDRWLGRSQKRIPGCGSLQSFLKYTIINRVWVSNVHDRRN